MYPSPPDMTSIEVFEDVDAPPLVCVDDLKSADDDGDDGLGEGRADIAESPPWPKRI